MSENSLAALPFLASAILTTAEAEESSLRAPVSCGLATIDDLALDGGFRYGEITSIAGATATGKTLLAFHAIVNHLVSSQESKVALIDTTGALPLARLRDVLVLRIHKQSTYEKGYQRPDSKHAKLMVEPDLTYDGLVRMADLMLTRVKYMRVFDLAGVVEAVDEVSESWEVQAQQTDGNLKGRERVIEDSEEEDDMSQDSSDEKDQTWKIRQIAGVQKGRASAETDPTDMIVIDTIANVVTSVASKSHIQGQALSTSFMRSLYLLTSRRRICTLLINAVVGLNKLNNPDNPRKPEYGASSFISVNGKPALGKTYTYLIDKSILLSSIPKTKDDANNAYGQDGNRSGWESVGVVEVIKDKNGACEGRWATFKVLADIDIRSAF